MFEEVVETSVQYLFKGYNSTLIVYGQTGTGKSHTMSGTESEPGIVQLTLGDVFAKLASHPGATVKMSYIEVYNEVAIDLLDDQTIVTKKAETKGAWWIILV